MKRYILAVIIFIILGLVVSAFIFWWNVRDLNNHQPGVEVGFGCYFDGCCDGCINGVKPRTFCLACSGVRSDDCLQLGGTTCQKNSESKCQMTLSEKTIKCLRKKAKKSDDERYKESVEAYINRPW